MAARVRALMRIVQVCAVDFTAYHLLRPLLHACRDAGWGVDFACADGPLAGKLRAEGFRHRSVPISRSPSASRLARAIAALALSLRKDRPDVVHTHTPAGGIVGRAAAIAAGGIAIAHTLHGLPILGPRPTAVERAYLVVERLLARRTDLFLSQSAGDVPRAVALGIARPDTVVIGNGVDLRRFAPDPVGRARARSALAVPPDAVVVLYVGRLVREKGLVELADATLALRDDEQLHVLVVGAALASDRTDVTALLDAHPVVGALGPRWRRLGYRDDIAGLLRAADIFVLPSYREGLPRSVIEAMASGLPVIASDIPACRELVEDGASGLLIPPRDAAALGRAMRALAGDPERRARLGAGGRARAVARHDERTIVARQVELLGGLVRAHR